jgi:hypothetical protein
VDKSMKMSQELLMREPALAMLMGAVALAAPSAGANVGFGNEYGYGAGHGMGFGLVSACDPSMNLGLPGMGFGYGQHMPVGYGYGFGQTPVAAQPPIHPSDPRHPQHAAAAAHQWELANPSSSTSRSLLLDPNRDSTIKVERYSFSFSPTANLVLGTASNIPTFTQQPSTSIKGQRVVMNAPVPGFVLISSLQIANVNVLVGGTEDAFTYSAGAQGVMLDLPRLDPQNRATSAGAYTGVLPPGYTQGNSFQFIITLQGPASLAGGYGQ